jgi:hypothetical protein
VHLGTAHARDVSWTVTAIRRSGAAVRWRFFCIGDGHCKNNMTELKVENFDAAIGPD